MPLASTGADRCRRRYAELRDARLGRTASPSPPSGEDYMVPLASAANRQASAAALIGQALSLILVARPAPSSPSPASGCACAPATRSSASMLWALLGASTIAILTTVGIVLSMLGETIHFFSEVNPLNFFFGTVWDPRFAAAGSGGAEGQFGLIPLLAGTLYIAFVSMLFAVPVGLMAAIYMGEYASSRGPRRRSSRCSSCSPASPPSSTASSPW